MTFAFQWLEAVASARRASAWLALAPLIVATSVAAPMAEPPKPVVERWEAVLTFKADAESVDFRLVDPMGRVAVVAVDSTMCDIPDCSAAKTSDFPDHDDSEVDSLDDEEVEWKQYGGGTFSMTEPAPGVWYLEAIASRECPDSCEVSLLMWSSRAVNQDTRVSMHQGDRVRWRVTMDPRDKREGRVWARFELDRSGGLGKVTPKKP